ncbi:MAG: Uma2 family endonuclease [Chloroflexi bacterium]|nr:Uma2 family endonuclease [Chloroflexota bacterium]
MVVDKQFISAEKFLELVEQPQYVDRVVELVEGEIVEMTRPSGQHGEITMMLSVHIANHVYQNVLGRVTAAETGFIVSRDSDGKDTVRGLDIAFVSFAKAPNPFVSRLIDVAPDLAVEVISPSNEAASIRLEVLQLLNAGTSLVWVVYPDNRIVDVHSASGAKTLHENDILSGGDVLPGFEIRVGDIFPK